MLSIDLVEQLPAGPDVLSDHFGQGRALLRAKRTGRYKTLDFRYKTPYIEERAARDARAEPEELTPSHRHPFFSRPDRTLPGRHLGRCQPEDVANQYLMEGVWHLAACLPPTHGVSVESWFGPSMLCGGAPDLHCEGDLPKALGLSTASQLFRKNIPRCHSCWANCLAGSACGLGASDSATKMSAR